MTEEWDNDGWSVASIHTWKTGDWCKAKIKYQRIAEDDTIKHFDDEIWRKPIPYFKPTGTIYEIVSPAKVIFTWYSTEDSSESQLVDRLKQTSVSAYVDNDWTPAADAARDAQSEDGSDEFQEPAAASSLARGPPVKRMRFLSPSGPEDDTAKRMYGENPPPPMPWPVDSLAGVGFRASEE